MLHENIRLKRKERGFSQEDLAARLHVVRQTVSKWENGTSVPSAEQLVALADILDTTVSELLGATTETGEDRDRLAEELARVNAQLAVRNHRTRRVLKIIAIALLVIAMMIVAIMTLNHMPASQLDSKVHDAMGSAEEDLLLDFALPRIEDGCWKTIDRDPETSAYTNVTFSRYDREARVAYCLKMGL